MNGDGFDDVIIGALRMNAAFSGAVYIVYGMSGKLRPAIQLTSSSTVSFTVLNGDAYSWFGYSVSGAGNTHFC